MCSFLTTKTDIENIFISSNSFGLRHQGDNVIAKSIQEETVFQYGINVLFWQTLQQLHHEKPYIYFGNAKGVCNSKEIIEVIYTGSCNMLTEKHFTVIPPLTNIDGPTIVHPSVGQLFPLELISQQVFQKDLHEFELCLKIIAKIYPHVNTPEHYKNFTHVIGDACDEKLKYNLLWKKMKEAIKMNSAFDYAELNSELITFIVNHWRKVLEQDHNVMNEISNLNIRQNLELDLSDDQNTCRFFTNELQISRVFQLIAETYKPFIPRCVGIIVAAPNRNVTKHMAIKIYLLPN